MTDGILVAEIASDPLLEAYDTLIVDEAHERSLNIDLVLGHVKGVLARTSRPPGDREFRDPRPEAYLGLLRRRPDHRGVGEDVPRRGPLRRARTPLPTIRWRRCRTRCGRSRGKVRGTSWCSSPASATSGKRPGPCAPTAGSRCYPSTPASTTRSRSGSSAPASGGGWFSRPTSRRPPSPCPASGSWSTRGSPASAGTAFAPGSSAFPSSRSRAPPPTSARGRCGRVGPGLCVRLYSREDFDSRAAVHPARRSGARTSRRSSSGWPRAGSGGSDEFPFIDPPDRRFVTDGLPAAPRARRVRRRTTASPGSGGGLPGCPSTPGSAG